MEVKTEKLDYSSKFTGVYKVGDKYRGYLKVNGEEIHLGVFDLEIEAAKSRENYIIINRLPNKLNNI